MCAMHHYNQRFYISKQFLLLITPFIYFYWNSSIFSKIHPYWKVSQRFHKCACLFICVFANVSDKRVLNCSEYDIGCDYDAGDDHYVGNIYVSGVHLDP